MTLKKDFNCLSIITTYARKLAYIRKYISTQEAAYMKLQYSNNNTINLIVINHFNLIPFTNIIIIIIGYSPSAMFVQTYQVVQ